MSMRIVNRYFKLRFRVEGGMGYIIKLLILGYINSEWFVFLPHRIILNILGFVFNFVSLFIDVIFLYFENCGQNINMMVIILVNIVLVSTIL